MNIEQIRELAQIVSDNGLSALEVNESDVHIRIECEKKAEAAPVLPIAAASTAAPANAAEGDPVDFNRAREIKSPMVGVFYASAAPGSKPFVEIGSHVKKGDVVCIVEAMKLMNELTAEFDGEVVDICVRDGDVVEYGQPLFRLC